MKLFNHLVGGKWPTNSRCLSLQFYLHLRATESIIEFAVYAFLVVLWLQDTQFCFSPQTIIFKTEYCSSQIVLKGHLRNDLMRHSLHFCTLCCSYCHRSITHLVHVLLQNVSGWKRTKHVAHYSVASEGNFIDDTAALGTNNLQDP